jgi:hypothetical protein
VKSFANHLQAQPNSNSIASTKVLKESKIAKMSDYKFDGWVGLDKVSAEGEMAGVRAQDLCWIRRFDPPFDLLFGLAHWFGLRLEQTRILTLGENSGQMHGILYASAHVLKRSSFEHHLYQ